MLERLSVRSTTHLCDKHTHLLLPLLLQAVWENTYIPCEHGTPEYKSTLASKSAACTAAQKKYEC